MLKAFIPKHPIQKHIIDVLTHQKQVRFRDLRPPGVDSNLYNYHLALLQRKDYVIKTDEGYTLGQYGLMFVDRNGAVSPGAQIQPKIIIMLLIQNSDGDLLVYRRASQPYIDSWTLPYGEMQIDDKSVLDGARRELLQKLTIDEASLRQVGDCYIRTVDSGQVITSTLAHVCRQETDAIKPNERLKWIQPTKLASLELAPAVEQIVARSFFGDSFFFEEFTIVN